MKLRTAFLPVVANMDERDHLAPKPSGFVRWALAGAAAAALLAGCGDKGDPPAIVPAK